MSPVPLPKWLLQLPPGERQNRAMNRFLIRLAALYASEAGTMEELARRIAVNPGTLKPQAQSVRHASESVRNGITRVVGPQFAPPAFPVDFSSEL